MDSILKCYIDIPFDCGSVHIRLIGVRIHVISQTILRCGAAEEIVTHIIFECPPALQTWELSSMPSNSEIFSVPSIYANMDYPFWRKNGILEPDDDRDFYPWIIWYI